MGRTLPERLPGGVSTTWDYHREWMRKIVWCYTCRDLTNGAPRGPLTCRIHPGLITPPMNLVKSQIRKSIDSQSHPATTLAIHAWKITRKVTTKTEDACNVHGGSREMSLVVHKYISELDKSATDRRKRPNSCKVPLHKLHCGDRTTGQSLSDSLDLAG